MMCVQFVGFVQSNQNKLVAFALFAALKFTKRKKEKNDKIITIVGKNTKNYGYKYCSIIKQFFNHFGLFYFVGSSGWPFKTYCLYILKAFYSC